MQTTEPKKPKKDANPYIEAFKLPRVKMEEQKKIRDKDKEEVAKADALVQADINDVKEHPRGVREVGSVYLSLQAQKIYDPATPQVMAPKGPPASMQGTGTGPAMGMTGQWSTPIVKEKGK